MVSIFLLCTLFLGFNSLECMNVSLWKYHIARWAYLKSRNEEKYYCYRTLDFIAITKKPDFVGYDYEYDHASVWQKEKVWPEDAFKQAQKEYAAQKQYYNPQYYVFFSRGW